ncbi:large ribosomal subunit protein mL40 isoform X2 [Macrobrachium rosenbergii]|uniref:large ribosomal subunit protein mL40 isoform X2 n=1 Tax=Macrobrachium rosenbergii TaxID=79674 RepID=UPI0034D5CB22
MSALSCASHLMQRLAVSAHGSQRCIVTATSPLLFRVSQVVCAEPLKKKKKVDPQVLRQREERKKKKIEKAIKRLEKNASQLKPIDEIDVPLSLLQEREMRTRTKPFISEVEEDYRSDVLKRWCQYKQQQSVAEVFMIDTLQESVNRALEMYVGIPLRTVQGIRRFVAGGNTDRSIAYTISCKRTGENSTSKGL